MITFHNKVADKTSTTLPTPQRFNKARKQVALHYQWMLRNDSGNMVKLASGQQMATLLKNKGVNINVLSRTQILDGSGGARLDHLTAAERDTVASRTPLWFYILREAELNSGKLKGVGGRIVAETFHRAMEGSRFSIVRRSGVPAFRPTFGPRPGTFEMTDLLFFAFAGKKAELTPAG